MLAGMTLNFPNPSRSYDAASHRIRFWGYDSAMEVPFFIEDEAIARIDATAQPDEAGRLLAFDEHRERIIEVAGRAYAKGRRGSYVLAAADF